MDTPDALAALVAVGEQTSEQAVLERLVEAAGPLTGAGFAAALLLGPDGQACALAHRGMSERDVAALPHLPRPVGLIAAVLAGQVVRLAEMAAHPRSVALPAGHVPMAALLGVPVQVGGRVLGGLYLTRSPGHGTFSAADESSATSAARQAGLALDAIRALRAADGLVDRLGAADDDTGSAGGGSSPTVRRLLAAARHVIGMDVTFLSELRDGVQRYTHVDRAPGGTAIELPEGTVADAADGYCRLMVDGAVPAAVPDVPGHPVLGALAVTSTLGVGAYCGVPVHLPDGTLHGTLCGLDPRAGTSPSAEQVLQLRTIARLLGVRLQRERDEEHERQAVARRFLPLVDGTLRRTVLQPIVELASGRTVGYEALARFREATGAARRPDEVFAQAHTLGLGVRLEQAAARSALQLLPLLPAGAYLSVNLSPRALLDPATYDLLSGVLVAGRPVVLELTEHQDVADYAVLVRRLDALRAQGMRLAVDDTGSGFASLQHVVRLRPDVVKLDIAFVRGVHRHPARRAVARAMIGFAQEIGADLVAEGVEGPAECDEMVRLGARYGQGFHLGRPLPVAEALRAVLAPG